MFGIYSANIKDEDLQTLLLPLSMLFTSVILLFHMLFSKKQKEFGAACPNVGIQFDRLSLVKFTEYYGFPIPQFFFQYD